MRWIDARTGMPEAEVSGSDRVHWIFKNKDQGKTAATASLGMITLWDIEGGLPQIDKYLYSKDNHVVAGRPSTCSHSLTYHTCLGPSITCGLSRKQEPKC